MKKLIYLLLMVLFAQNVFGQDPRVRKIIDREENYMKMEISYYLLLLFEEYEIDCHNDSTKQVNGYGQSIFCGTYPAIHKYQYYDTVYIHRKPSFNDFIDWLKENHNYKKRIISSQ